VSAARDDLHALVEQLPEQALPRAAADLRARLSAVPGKGTWPPAWFGMGEGSPDVSERADEILTEELGRAER
jgi:hypothetical protein